MNIAFFGYDFFLQVARELVRGGHRIVHVQTCEFPPQDNYNSSRETRAFAAQASATLGVGNLSPGDMGKMVNENNVELVLLAGFPHKVHLGPETRALNLHPTLLPDGRGPYPLPWVILESPQSSGLTLHKVSDEMDAGEIVAQRPVSLTGGESLELLVARLQVEAPSFVLEVVDQLTRLWAVARPQGRGAAWKATEADWTLNWTAGVDHVVRQVRAFGRLQSSAWVDGEEWSVADAEGWRCGHALSPGTLVQVVGSDLVVAASDGFVLLKSPTKDGAEEDESCA